MEIRITICFTLPLLAAASVFAAAGNVDTEEVNFNSPVQIPESLLPPGKYTIHLEDRLPDRAIVRITEPDGAEHYLLTVPSKNLAAASKGLIYFPGSNKAQAIHAWGCTGCKKPLEFVYPKDEAVKLTEQTGKPILAFDPSYDKLPSNLSAEDRKVVTLWMLAPKTIAPDGKGEGLTAAKYSVPKLMATSEPLPARMPKTSTNAFSELAIGVGLLILSLLLGLRRKSVMLRQ